MWLNKRNSYLLNGLINIYPSTRRKPVDSKELAQFSPFSESTIQKKLQKSVTYFFLYKPGESAGRIPSNRGIKHYLKQPVDNFQTNHDIISRVDRFSAHFSKILSKKPMEV
jgi:transcriptional regulator of heat shock response